METKNSNYSHVPKKMDNAKIKINKKKSHTYQIQIGLCSWHIDDTTFSNLTIQLAI